MRRFLATVLSLALTILPVRASAQDHSSQSYTLKVGHVVILTWQASSTMDVTSYNVYVSNTSGGPYIAIGSTSLLTFLDIDTTAGLTYYYVVTAVDVNGESVFSSEVSVKIPTP